ncbi:hypothetical protein [Halarchaeum acidiphilum]
MLTSGQYACSAHLVVESDTDRDAVLERARHVLGEGYGIDHATIQVEAEIGECTSTELDCYPAGDD